MKMYEFYQLIPQPIGEAKEPVFFTCKGARYRLQYKTIGGRYFCSKEGSEGYSYKGRMFFIGTGTLFGPDEEVFPITELTDLALLIGECE